VAPIQSAPRQPPYLPDRTPETQFVTAKDEREVEAWLVLLEDPKGTLGYGIAYDEETERFGLIQLAKGYEPCLLGLYGGFFDALDAM